MTKYTAQFRQELCDRIMEATPTQRLLTKGVAATAKENPGILIARAMGFNKNGKFAVNGERKEGSNNKWQRYFAKGCPELLEYLARLDFMAGQEFNPDTVFFNPIPRNHASEVTMGWESGVEKPDTQLEEWVKQLPNWGELYTPNGLNFYALFFLYILEFDTKPNHKQLLCVCDRYDSPYTIRFCQGKPQNDNVAELAYKEEASRLLGKEYVEPVAPEPEIDKVEVVLAALLELKQKQELQKAKEELELAVSGCGSLDMSDITIPETLEEIADLTKRIYSINALEHELGCVYEE